jgi:hypothetical protein
MHEVFIYTIRISFFAITNHAHFDLLRDVRFVIMNMHKNLLFVWVISDMVRNVRRLLVIFGVGGGCWRGDD